MNGQSESPARVRLRMHVGVAVAAESSLQARACCGLCSGSGGVHASASSIGAGAPPGYSAYYSPLLPHRAQDAKVAVLKETPLGTLAASG